MIQCIECNDTGFVIDITYWDTDIGEYKHEERPCEDCEKHAELREQEGNKTLVYYAIVLEFRGITRYWQGDTWRDVCGIQFSTSVKALNYASVNLQRMLKCSNMCKDNIKVRECIVNTTGVEFSL